MSLRRAINAKCAECIYSPSSGAGGKLQQIDACTSYLCPLFHVRPEPKKPSKLVFSSTSDAFESKPMFPPSESENIEPRFDCRASQYENQPSDNRGHS